jgi:hypothetical protein
MYLSDEQLKSIVKIFTYKDLLAFKPELSKLSYSKDLELEWYARSKPHRKYLYCQTHPDSKILAVAHTDINGLLAAPQMSYDRKLIKARQLDDRLGCWLIMSYLREVLPQDQPYDILLTDCEEIGDSTAQFFTPPEGKQYNWMFEWDRRGTDVVMYDYETPELKKLLEVYKFEVGKGSFTDICYLSHLNCAGFNFGTAYYGEHTNDCYANLERTYTQVNKFIPFYSEWYGKQLKHDHEAAYKKNMQKIHGYNWNDKKKDTHTTGDRGPKKPMVGGLVISGINNPPETDDRGSLVINDRIRTVSMMTSMEIAALDDDEYLMWAAFVNSHKNDDKKIEKGQALLKQMAKKRKQYYNGVISNVTYTRWVEGEITKYQEQVLNPGSEDIVDQDQKDFWLEEQLRREAQDEEWREYMLSDSSALSFQEWKRDKEIAAAGGIVYDDSDNYYKKEAQSFDRRHALGSDDTDVMNPSDEDLLALENEEIAARVMEDPLYSSDQFPGGKEARSQHFDNLPNDLT